MDYDSERRCWGEINLKMANSIDEEVSNPTRIVSTKNVSDYDN